MWYFILALLIVILIVYIVASYIKDRRAIDRKTVESLGDELWREIDEERHGSIERGKRFRRALKKARNESKRR